MKIYRVLPFFLALVLVGCGNDNQLESSNCGQVSGDWLLPTNEIFDGGPGCDGIPALTSPNLITTDEASYLSDEDLVVGVVFNGEARAYSHIVLDWHEIINDQIGENAYALTYCPLTGTAVNWNRVINGEVTTFGVSGLLFNSNLIPFDRSSGSNWSQMRNESVNGERIGTQAELLVHVETTWATWKALYPNTMVVSTNTGISRQYGTYPYINSSGEDYRVDPFLIFPVSNDDARLDRKERVLGIKVGDESKAYRFDDFPDIQVRQDQVGTASVVIVGSSEHNFLVAYGSELENGTVPEFHPADETQWPVIMSDDLGNTWDVFGRAVNGPNAGESLAVMESYIGYWFAWATFNPNIQIAEF